MKTLKKVKVEVEYIGDNDMPKLSEMKDGIIYISEEREIAIHKCLCGTCGNETVMPLNRTVYQALGMMGNNKKPRSHGWDFTKNDNGTITFTPSVGNFQFPCKSHYIITNSVANFV